MSHHDHAPEYRPGIPAPLPDGERPLWQGSPRWQSLALRALHVRKVALYFGVLVAWRVGAELFAGQPLSAALGAGAPFLVPAVLAIGLLLFIAWQMARTTIYTITNERLILRFGIALPMTANIPFTLIESAALKNWNDGTGDIPVTVKPGNGVSWLVFWPHVRPWSFGNAQPMLRSIPEAEQVAELFAAALARAAGQTVPKRAADTRTTDTGTDGGSLAAAAR
ncbi:MAG: photosynthetic complex putative assembly protein PuhB [Gammaproteobacteria bacterium]|jgi:hypothetical protein